MIDHLPFILPAGVVAIAVVMVFLFYRATNRNRKALLIVCSWLVLQAAVALTGFYTHTNLLPPRPFLLVVPPFVLILFVVFHPRFRAFREQIDLGFYTWLHALRTPIEWCLLGCYLYGWMPKIMTFEGWNFDILSGLSALPVAWFCFVKKQWSLKVAFWWNVAALVLLLNIMVLAVLSVPSPIQQLAFEQPNRAVLYFPFVWIPSFFVPAVLLGHLVAIRRLGR